MQLEGTFPLKINPGIQRDGTVFASNNCIDGKWVRWQRGLPRKMGGFRNISNSFSGPVRGAFLDGSNGYNWIYGGSANTLEMMVTDDTGAGAGLTDRTPAGFVTSKNNIWQFDTLYDGGGTSRRVIAHAAPNLTAIDSTTQAPIYYGDANGYGALISTGTSVSGGVFSMPPYMMALDNDGYVLWSPPNVMNFTYLGSGNARVAPNKLIKGVRTRGGSGFSPAGLIWSLNELYRTYFVGGAAVFEFDYIGDTELMSSSAVVEYNGRYYWPDLNGFKAFAGTIEDLPNDMNLNYFYDNINILQRQKVWGYKNPRYNEISWFWPKGNATECTDVITYNVKEKVWYDTAWPSDQKARSIGFFSKSFQYPIMFGLDPNGAGKYVLWQHEFGYDRVQDNIVYAINSQFTTADISYCADISPGMSIGMDRWIELKRIEPDFVSSGQMNVVINGNSYANTKLSSSSPYLFDNTTNKIDMKEQRRQLNLTFQSNVVGGNFQMGKILMDLSMGDGRQ